MPSRKQVALADLMSCVACSARGPQSAGAMGRLLGGKRYQRVLEDLYLVHRIPLSILEADFTKNDIDFVNHAVPSYLEAVGEAMDPRVAFNLVEIYEAIPPDCEPEITSVLPDWVRAIGRSAESSNDPGSEQD